MVERAGEARMGRSPAYIHIPPFDGVCRVCVRSTFKLEKKRDKKRKITGRRLGDDVLVFDGLSRSVGWGMVRKPHS